LRYFYSAADVFISVPWYEPFGITPLEAMACGVPVIGSRVGGVKYTVEDGVTGILVPPHDPDAVAAAVGRLLNEERVRDRMGRAGRERVNAAFTWEQVTRSLETLYSEVAPPALRVDNGIAREAVTLGDTASMLTGYARAVESDAGRAARLIAETVMTGGTVLVCGNGGSAADAQHLASELVGRFTLERQGVPAIALTGDSAVMTALGNDYGFDQVFARQLEALGHAGDVLLAISTSGRSPNILKALEVARSRSIRTIGLLGRDGGQAKRMCDVSVVVPTNVTARIQEVHQLVVHHFAAAVDEAYAAMMASRDVTLATSLPQGYLA
jgi:phosphoheptose isomerase